MRYTAHQQQKTRCQQPPLVRHTLRKSIRRWSASARRTCTRTLSPKVSFSPVCSLTRQYSSSLYDQYASDPISRTWINPSQCEPSSCTYAPYSVTPLTIPSNTSPICCSIHSACLYLTEARSAAMASCSRSEQWRLAS